MPAPTALLNAYCAFLQIRSVISKLFQLMQFVLFFYHNLQTHEIGQKSLHAVQGPSTNNVLMVKALRQSK